MTTLGYALLGLLARRPLSGYDLAGQLKVPVVFFWHARISQIYPELARLEAQSALQAANRARWGFQAALLNLRNQLGVRPAPAALVTASSAANSTCIEYGRLSGPDRPVPGLS